MSFTAGLLFISSKWQLFN